MSASTTRQVRHKIPLPLSIVARPHEAGPILSWRADSLALVWLDSGITPCCKTPKMPCYEFFAKRGNKQPSPIDVTLSRLSKSPVSSSLDDVVPPHIFRSPLLRSQTLCSMMQRTFATLSARSGHLSENFF